MAPIKIEIEIDVDRLSSYSDQHLATCWHVAQANPAPIEDRDAGALAETIGREIIRRWIKAVSPELWHHQGRHHYWDELVKLAEWKGGRWVPKADGKAADPGGSIATAAAGSERGDR